MPETKPDHLDYVERVLKIEVSQILSACDEIRSGLAHVQHQAIEIRDHGLNAQQFLTTATGMPLYISVSAMADLARRASLVNELRNILAMGEHD